MAKLDLDDPPMDTLQDALRELKALRLGPAVTMDVVKSSFAMAKQILRTCLGLKRRD